MGTAAADITKLSVSGSFTASNKVYDGGTAASVTGRQVLGAVHGDNVALSGGTGAFEDKNVGNGKTVTLSGASLTGTDAGNYDLGSVASATADITPKSVTGSFATSNKVYDGNTAAAATNRGLTGVVAGDAVSLSGGTASFDTKNVGTDKVVTLSGATLAGGDAANYTLTSVGNQRADITKLSITGSFAADNKVYDGNTSATVASRSVNGAIAGDAVSLSGGTAVFADKNVGNGKTVTLSGATLAGTDAANYNLTSVGTAAANITPKSITGSFTAADKVYDGNASATVSGRSLNGAVAGDAVSLTGGTASFDNANVGTNKVVTLTGASLSGTDAANYNLTGVDTTTASIHYAWNGFLQPINDTAHQIGTTQSKFKLGQTIPAKFVIKDAAGNVVQQAGNPTFSRSTNRGACDSSATLESIPTLDPAPGVAYAWDGTQYHYNWSTKGLTSGVYRIYANLADGTARYVDICLTK